MAHEDVEESERDERDEEELTARVRGLLSGDRSEGRGGGGYASLLTPSGIENAKTDAVRFGGAVVELIRAWHGEGTDTATGRTDDREVVCERIRRTLPWVSVFNRYVTVSQLDCAFHEMTHGFHSAELVGLG